MRIFIILILLSLPTYAQSDEHNKLNEQQKNIKKKVTGFFQKTFKKEKDIAIKNKKIIDEKGGKVHNKIGDSVTKGEKAIGNIFKKIGSDLKKTGSKVKDVNKKRKESLKK